MVPAIKDDYPSELKNALDRRRRGAFTGRCDCGGTYAIRKGTLAFQHGEGCSAHDEGILEIAKHHGIAWELIADTVLEEEPEKAHQTTSDAGLSSLSSGPVVKAPEWLERSARALVDRDPLARRACQHLLGADPQPKFVRLGEPHDVLCANCLAVAAVKSIGTDEDLRCDLCGEIRDQVTAFSLQGDHMVVVIGGYCELCRQRGEESWPVEGT
jgi:hypothetical protein